VATYGKTVRRGLPRRRGEEPWPPAAHPGVEREQRDETPQPVAQVVERAQRDETSAERVESPSLHERRPARRGLPRVAGGEPWPPPQEAPVVERAQRDETRAEVDDAPAEVDAFRLGRSARSLDDRDGDRSALSLDERRAVRRGLPRTPGGEPWPPADYIPAVTAEIIVETAGESETAVAVPVAASVVDVSTPIPFTRTAWAGAAAASRPTALAEPAPTDTIGAKIRATPWTLKLGGLVGALALLMAALAGVFLVRAVLSAEVMQEWLARYPGEYHLPEASTPGFPAWVRWQHFFNTFFIVLIIRTGLQVRTEKRPSVFWTPKWSKNGRGKISLALWFHQSLDVLWLVNGVLFVVLLFATNHWMRVVPTSWEVFPNALSALLQYVSLDWPTENGWVNYNSLQQLMYSLTIFVAAPLAAITGVRMSGLWPRNAKTLSRLYPVEWARAVHFPVMLYFVGFIVVHVALVFATGALRNLNHMYAGSDVVNWAGFWIFTGSIVLLVAGWIAARPLVLAPIAALSGKVSGR